MLSSNSSSSIQKRRQQHRRQQSLEVPILATPLPANHRRNPQAQSSHRRGHSLDQSRSALATPTGFRPLQPQDHADHPVASPSVRIQFELTNPGHPTNQQHFVQETQQQGTPVAQPGYIPQDFQSHLQQQLNGNVDVDFKPVIASPQPQNPQQLQALQELEHHMAWYRDNFDHSPISTAQAQPIFDACQQSAVEMPGAPMAMPLLMTQAPQGTPQTPVPPGHARTVPNTPQNYTRAWPSPPPTHPKHARSQSFQLDVAPMPLTGNTFVAESFMQPLNSFGNDATFTNDGGYASSAYSSSAIDPLSPLPQQNIGPLPTLFEEPTVPFQHAPGPFDGTSILLQATAGAQDFNDPNFDFDGPIEMSPRQQLLNNLGPHIPATIVETGVLAYEVQQYIGELSDSDNKYGCMWEGCGRRFGRKENVRAHVQTHLGDRQFMCNLCDKTFVRQHDLKRHIAIHSDNRPFVCPCGTGFARHDALTRHRQRGMCPGALPGFEKTEEEKPKRGRPKKERPSLEDRTDKASKQRKMNKTKQPSSGSSVASAGDMNGEEDEEPEVQILYASSSSSGGGSDGGFPVTPPDTSDMNNDNHFDADAFLNMANADIGYDGLTSSWRDTPPTSPMSASPSKTADSVDALFDFGAPLRADIGVSPAELAAHNSPHASIYSSHHDNTSPFATAHTPESTHHNSDPFSYASPAASSSAILATADNVAGSTSFSSASFDGASSPIANHDDDEVNDLLWFHNSPPNHDFLTAEADAPQQVFDDIFSPAGESGADGSSVYGWSEQGETVEVSEEMFRKMDARRGGGVGMTAMTAVVEFAGGYTGAAGSGSGSKGFVGGGGGVGGGMQLGDLLGDWLFAH
ncbi:Metallothionein expression activator [Friedmanniomyces endolithicus]|uniref:Metallothionein expression activator n=1 Tax=Friedmanniomyces endolithicus TaxID=329885 RepID=A0AAN6QKE5_9PEZI|nr:Metallothionein expression activator [Friedmanniomyces endolithicus]KAK0800109.1 Metallothionein expression activator [Friedmanniomyces endolithicus]KAK0810050.1 Metallothionein expression activator [Friedmanniomyces endolithicus]KAK0907290.1 Metallothionein expression activator [Friedmanniomyces endolithicus]KAK0968569.1 Metallothionein expression activator [Friedmanniomyces endolithicus]